MNTFICRVCGNTEYVSNGGGYKCSNCTVSFVSPEKFSIPKTKYKKLSKHAKMPEKAYFDDAAFDLFSAEDKEIKPGETKLVKTNIAIQLPHNYEAQVRARSGLAKKGIQVANGPGTIDTSYRGDCGVLLYNSTSESYIIKKEDKIAQMVICKNLPILLEEVDKLDETERGSGGFGSTGR